MGTKYKNTKNKDGTAEEFRMEREMLDKHYDANMPMEKHFTSGELKFASNYNTGVKTKGPNDEFLSGFDEEDQKVTLKLTQYLHKNPHLFSKIRILQRKNKILNAEEMPEIRRLQVVKENIVGAFQSTLIVIGKQTRSKKFRQEARLAQEYRYHLILIFKMRSSKRDTTKMPKICSILSMTCTQGRKQIW